MEKVKIDLTFRGLPADLAKLLVDTVDIYEAGTTSLTKQASTTTVVNNDVKDEILTIEAPYVSATPPPPAAPVSGLDLDVAGLPWDKRIHSSSKNKNADGTWRYMRGLSDTIKTAVLAELRGKSVAPVTPPPQAAPVTPPPQAAPVTPPPQAAPVTPPPPQAAPVTPPPPQAAPVTKYEYVATDGMPYTMEALKAAGWAEEAILKLPVSQKVSIEPRATKEGNISDFFKLLELCMKNNVPVEKSDAAAIAEGLTDFQFLGTRPDLVPKVAARLGFTENDLKA